MALGLRCAMSFLAAGLPLAKSAVSDYGENCTYSDECNDHRMVCVANANNVTKCVCDRFHTWVNKSTGCIQTTSTKYILSLLGFFEDNETYVDHDDEKIWWAVASALFVTVILFLSVLIVITFCIISKKSDRKLKSHVTRLKNSLDRKKQRMEVQQV